MLEQYNLMHALNNAVVFGYLYQLQSVEENQYSIIDEIKKINPEIPIVKTNDFGHKHANSIIPIGINAIINAKYKSIKVEDYLK